MDRGRGGGRFEWFERFEIRQELRAAKAGVALTALRVEDPERGPLARRPVSIAGDQDFRPLTDDVPSEPDPGTPDEFQAQAGGLGHGGGQAAAGTERLEDDEDRVRSSGEGGQATEPVGDAGRVVRRREPSARQVQEEQVHRATGQQRAGDGQALVQGRRGDDDEPLQVDAAGDGLHRIEGSGKIQPGHHGTLCLGLRRDPEREGGPAAGAVAADGDTGRSGQTAGPQDRIERRESGVDDAVVVRRRPWLVPRLLPGEWRRCQRERPVRGTDDRTDVPRSCRSPASLEARHGCRHVRGEGRHRMVIVEHPF